METQVLTLNLLSVLLSRSQKIQLQWKLTVLCRYFAMVRKLLKL